MQPEFDSWQCQLNEGKALNRESNRKAIHTGQKVEMFELGLLNVQNAGLLVQARAHVQGEIWRNSEEKDW